MLTVLIVDDETWICQLIGKIIEWEKLGFELIGEAEDGLTAYNLICSRKPDVVITDIRMPGMDGIDIVKKTREAEIKTNFIIISGFKQFEYAHSALKFGVEDYLLKPINKVELTDTLIKIRDRIMESNHQAIEEAKIRDQLANSINKLKEQFLNNLILNTDETDADHGHELEKVNSEYQFRFREGCFHTIIMKLDRKNDEPVDENYRQLCQSKLFEIARKCFRDICFEIQSVTSVAGIVYIFNYSPDSAEKFRKAVRQMFQDAKQYLDILDCFHLTIGIGAVVNDLNQIYQSYEIAIKSIKCRIGMGVDMIINYPDLGYVDVYINEIFTEEKERQLVNLIEVLDVDGFQKWVRGMFDTVSNKKNINPDIYFQISEKTMDVFSVTLSKIILKIQKEHFFEDKHVFNTYEYKNIEEMENNLLKFLVQYMEACAQLIQTQNFAPIRIAKAYISENYNKSINLKDIAEIVKLNPVYFSIIFKKETGMNFSDYLTNYRLDIAKKLLVDIKYNISEVAEMTGYSDQKYFSKLFKKVVGVTPIEYRKIHL
jgi:two-component system response regulator YesN